MICGNIFQSPLNFSIFLKNTLTFIKHSTGICSLENRRRSRMLLAGPERVMDLGEYFHLVSHINIYLQRHSLALMCLKTVVRLSSVSETCTATQYKHIWKTGFCQTALFSPLAEWCCNASLGSPSYRGYTKEHPLCLTELKACHLLCTMRIQFPNEQLAQSLSTNARLLYLFLKESSHNI